MIAKLRNLWRMMHPEIPTNPEERERAIIRQSVARRARGNVLLQQGHYLTKDGLARRRKEVLSHSS